MSGVRRCGAEQVFVWLPFVSLVPRCVVMLWGWSSLKGLLALSSGVCWCMNPTQVTCSRPRVSYTLVLPE